MLTQRHSRIISFLRLNSTTLHTSCAEYQTPVCHERNTNMIDSQISTIPKAAGSTQPSTSKLQPRKCRQCEMEARPAAGKWEKNRAGAGSLPEERFSTEKDIRLPVLPFVRSIVHLTHRISFSWPHGYLLKVFRSCTRFLYSLLFSDISHLLLLFVSIKVLCRAVT